MGFIWLIAAIAGTGTIPAAAAPAAPAVPERLRPKSASEAPDPTPVPDFASVYAAPDDAALNVAYARDQDKGGHLLSAAAAFERILLQQPDDDAVRLMYVDVLLRLDDTTGARREIAKLDPLTLDPGQKAQLAQENGRLAAAEAGGQP